MIIAVILIGIRNTADYWYSGSHRSFLPDCESSPASARPAVQALVQTNPAACFPLPHIWFLFTAFTYFARTETLVVAPTAPVFGSSPHIIRPEMLSDQ